MVNNSNHLLRCFESDGVGFGVLTTLISPAVVEICGDTDLDFVWADFEHVGQSPYDSTLLEALTRAADVADIELVVRTPSNDPPLIRKVLDSGVRNLLIPRVKTAEEVRQAAETTKFTYDGEMGERGVGGGRANLWGLHMDDGFLEREDNSILLGIMVETKEAVDNLDEILSVPELGFVLIGTMDLAHSLECAPDIQHPDLLDAVDTIRNACIDAGVPVGKITLDPDNIPDAVDEGYQMMVIGNDLLALHDAFSRPLEVVDDIDGL
jgi:2-dehydro-3-deoxyglucarate aldolase